MSLRSYLKQALYRPRGRFRYFGETVHFPRESVIFRLACEQGIYEHDNLYRLQRAVRPATWVFDVGANIGLMSAPLLQEYPDLHVVSVEPSPVTSRCLETTIAGSPNRARWHFVGQALGDRPGQIHFHASDVAGGAFDGVHATGRVSGVRQVSVSMTTLDLLWTQFGRPPVSAIKIDVEGAETLVLRGGGECLAASRPLVLLEWNPINLAAYQLAPESLLSLAQELGYDIYWAQSLARIDSAAALRLASQLDESFLLLPR